MRPHAAARASSVIAAEIFCANMTVGMLVLPRGAVGMIEASIRASRRAAHASSGADHRIAVVGLAHAAGAERVKGAGDVLSAATVM
jgi:hypothetical protein